MSCQDAIAMFETQIMYFPVFQQMNEDPGQLRRCMAWIIMMSITLSSIGIIENMCMLLVWRLWMYMDVYGVYDWYYDFDYVTCY